MLKPSTSKPQEQHYSLAELNALSAEQANFAFTQCCTASLWVQAMVAARPFESIEQCQQQALVFWQGLGESDFLEAFEGHPKIGDVSNLRAKYAHTKALASGEQSAVSEADEATIQALAEGNQQYQDQNGFIFIVCATGKSAAEMLSLLQARLANNREQELTIAAEQQSQITAIRINKLLSS